MLSNFRHTLALLLLAGLPACATSDRDIESEARTELERRAWPATPVLVVEHGRMRLNLGFRTPRESNPQDLVYPLGSISKMFTAAGLHRLAERGEVDLDAPVARYLPDWPPHWGRVRVHQLLGHTSGVPDFWFVPEAARLVEDPTARAADLAAVMARQPLQFEPGSRFSYSNTGYQAAARVIERVTGVSYDAFLARELFAPLGMSSMRACRGDADEMPGHVMRDAQLLPRAPENYETARGDGGLCGNARDLARWFVALAGGALARGPSWQGYMSPQTLSDGSQIVYGHGLSLRPLASFRKIGHHGAMAGHTGMAGWYPERDLIVIVLTSIGGVSADAVEQRLAATWLGVEKPRPFDEEPLPAHAGRFDVGPFVINLERRGRALWLTSPRPGPSGRLVRIGAASYALDGDPWSVAVHEECSGERCTSVRLHMAGMEWPGRRVDP
jgi:CubicO group peptidase (beta-lactamase class C family)